MKKHSERRKHCAPAAVPHRLTEFAMAVVRQSQKIFPAADPLPGGAGPPNLTTWIWSLTAPTDPVWWRSMHAISSYRGNRHRPPAVRPSFRHRQDRLQYTAPLCLACSVIIVSPARRTLQPSSSPYTHYASGAQRALRHEYLWSTGYDHGVVHINHVVTCTANQSGLVTLTFDLLTLKVVSESCVTWATSVPILVFIGFSVLELRPMYATDRRQTKASLNAPAY